MGLAVILLLRKTTRLFRGQRGLLVDIHVCFCVTPTRCGLSNMF